MQTATREFCFLSANQKSTQQHSANQQRQDTIDGLIASVPDNDWQALDEREFSYTRHPVGHLVEPPTISEHIQTYSVPTKDYQTDVAPKPILLSYLDVVLLGYKTVFGPEGALRFITSTDNWDRPIFNDRSNPIYPRHQALSSKEQLWIDQLLEKIPAYIK